jgi:hypothetical protein
MRPGRATILLHPIVLLSLIILLANDCYWKYEYHNWLTGKLSDIAGLILLPAFLHAFITGKKSAVITSILFFIWWKSELSQSTIDLANSWFDIHVGRTIDYSDLLCLPVASILLFIEPPIIKISIRRFAIPSMSMLCLFAFCNTTPPRGIQYIRDNEVTVYDDYPTSKSKEELLQKLRSSGIEVYPETARYYPVREEALYYRRNKNDSTQYVRLSSSGDSMLFVKRVSDTFYVIPYHIFNGDSLYNIEFSIRSSGKKKRPWSVNVQSFQTNSFDRGEYYNQPLRKRLKKEFARLFE